MGETIQQDAGQLIARWADRARTEQPTAARVHHDILVDHLLVFLWELGRTLAEGGDPEPTRATRTAEVHGDQRWETGWSLAEVVRDYQILRIVIIEYLEEVVREPLSSRELVALGVAIDDAILTSVTAYHESHRENVEGGGRETTPDDLLNVLGMLGHELRNPLAPLGNALQILRLAPDNVAQVEKTRLLMERQFRVMTRLVEDMMDLPRLARGKLTLKREMLDLTAVLGECAEDRRAALAQLGIQLTLNLPPVPVWTSGDYTRLCQAVGNLLGNAQKFTDRGGVIELGLDVDLTHSVAIVRVKDSGVGIDQAFLPRVFDSFMQSDRTMERSRGGLGLGLALVRGIVEQHGGVVKAFSNGPGTGAEFCIELPLLRTPEATEEIHSPTITSPLSRRVLIIEDNQDSAESLKLYLELEGHQVSIAHTGPDGIAAAETLLPEAVICDLGLPGKSGFEVCSELRSRPAFQQLLIIALSGHGDDESKEHCLTVGFDTVLIKPADPNEVANLLSHSRASLANQRSL